MGVYAIYKTLSSEAWWSKQSRAMRWLAARYYAGVDNYNDLNRFVYKGILSAGEFFEIIKSR